MKGAPDPINVYLLQRISVSEKIKVKNQLNVRGHVRGARKFLDYAAYLHKNSRNHAEFTVICLYRTLLINGFRVRRVIAHLLLARKNFYKYQLFRLQTKKY